MIAHEKSAVARLEEKGMDVKRQVLESSRFIDCWLDFVSWYYCVPGLTVGIQVGDEPVFARAYGYADLDARREMTLETRFRIASHSKLFTATAVMRLVDEGRLQLDDRVRAHLDWFRSNDDPNMADITVRSLLTHASGLNRDGTTAHWSDDEFPDAEAVVAQAAAGVSVFATGEHWKYSNLGYTLLGQIIEAVTGSRYEDAVTELVLVPLGLEETTPDFDEASLGLHATGYGVRYPGRARESYSHVHARAMNSATGFSSTVGDLLRFYAAHRLGDSRVLSDAAKREMHRTQFEDGIYRWAIGFSVDDTIGSRTIGHGGAYPGFMTASSWAPGNDVTVVVLTNAMDGRPQLFLDGIHRLIRYGVTNADVLATAPEDDPAFIEGLTGIYGSRWGTFVVGRMGGKLVTLPTNAPNPAAALLRHEARGDRRFSPMAGPQNGPFGEIVTAVGAEGDYRLRTGYSEQHRFPFERDEAWLKS